MQNLLALAGSDARPSTSAQSLPAAAALPPNLGIAWPVAALPPELLAAQHALAAQLADAAAAAAARPAGPRVFSVTDRQVYVEDDVNHPSVYVMARRWVHNDPEGAMEPMPQEHPALSLPPPLPEAPAASDDAPPVYPAEDDDTYDPAAVMLNMKSYWEEVRRYHTRTVRRRRERYAQRLQLLLAHSHSSTVAPQL